MDDAKAAHSVVFCPGLLVRTLGNLAIFRTKTPEIAKKMSFTLSSFETGYGSHCVMTMGPFRGVLCNGMHDHLVQVFIISICRFVNLTKGQGHVTGMNKPRGCLHRRSLRGRYIRRLHPYRVWQTWVSGCTTTVN